MEATKDVVNTNEISVAEVETSAELHCLRELTALELGLVGGGSGTVLFI